MKRILRLYEISAKMIYMMKLPMYFTCIATEKHGGKYIEPINIGSRAKQGCVMSPTLLFIIISRLDNETGT
jgi:hypothetical protein